MDWIELIVHTTTEGADIVSDLLCEAGATGTQIVDRTEVLTMPQSQGMWNLIDERVLADMPEDVLVKAYFPQSASVAEMLAALTERLGRVAEMALGFSLGSLALERSTVHEDDWAERWKQYYKPFRAGDRLVVKPTWETYATRPDDIVLEMDPGMAFGTGTHETTAMCLRQLERYVRPGCECADVGCGTGILAIAAAKLGAQHVLAIDIDPDAVKVAARNVALNGVKESVRVRQGDLLNEGGAPVDVMVANIIADAICELAQPARQRILPGGVLICSGIIREREGDVLAALAQAGYAIDTRLEQGEWVCLAAKR